MTKEFRLTRRGFVKVAGTGLIVAESGPLARVLHGETSTEAAHFSEEHLAAVNRQRRVIVNYDSGPQWPLFDQRIGGATREQVVKLFFDTPENTNILADGSQVDSIWWNVGEGSIAYWPSKILPMVDFPGWRKWFEDGFDYVKVLVEETHRRGLEAFFSYRINGSEMLRPDGAPDIPTTKTLIKIEHPEWLHKTWNKELTHILGYFDFAIPEVRAHKVSVLREVAENYDFDGIEIDFARMAVCLRSGRQWEDREHLTNFMRAVRAMTLEVEKERGRPFLLAARIPENIEGCHFDGIEVERWAREQLVDLFALGCRSFDVDIPAFRRITQGTIIKLYPSIDDHHATDAYEHPPIEVFRGVFSNWWQQGADGIQTFNFANTNSQAVARSGLWKDEEVKDYFDSDSSRKAWALHRQAYREMGSPATLKNKNKAFVVQRRGGGHGPQVIANPDDWRTPRWMYFNTNMFASLPAVLANDGKADTFLFVYIGEDVNALSPAIEQMTVHLLLSDPEAATLPKSMRLDEFVMACHGQVPNPFLPNIPPAKGIEDQVEVRANNILLGPAQVQGAWLVLEAEPRQFALGNNLVGVRLTQPRADTQKEVFIELLEVHVNYA